MNYPWKTYVAIGDSFTLGIGDTIDGLELIGTADLLASEIKKFQPNLIYKNLAVADLTAAEIKECQFGPAIEFKPDIISIIAGANDILRRSWSPSNFETTMREMFNEVQSKKILLITANWPEFPFIKRLPSAISQRFIRNINSGNLIIKRLADEYNAVFLDVFTLSKTMGEIMWSKDGIHPNSLGYERICEEIITRLKDYLSQR